MEKNEILKAILDLLAREFNCSLDQSCLTSQQSITEICGLDSLEFVRFICAVEKHFEVKFSDDVSFEALNKFDDLAGEIMKLKGAASCPADNR